MPDPPVSDHENEESEPEPEPQPEQARRRTPQQRPRSETPQRRRARDRDPEDFNFMPQHANPGGNRNDPGQEDPNVDDQVSSNQMLTNSSKMWINRCQTKVSNKSRLVNINQGYKGKGNIHTMLKP